MTARQDAIAEIARHRVAKTQDYLEDAGADIYGQYVFDEVAQRQYLAKPIFKKLRRTIEGHEPFDPAIIDAVAHGVKEWALAHGATHYTHWFVPMTGSTAEKHDSFLTPTGDGQTIAEFSGKNLVQGEPDASSFPSGGIRATFEARGYTAWDVTSPIFLQVEPNGVTMTIPTAFVSYTGEALDHKIPLLRSQEALGAQALRILRWFGNDTATRVFTNIGPEQEYFLVDRRLAEQRPDLVLTGRTLFGAPSPKGQELEDQYFGSIRERILAFMMDLDRELWRLGIPAKTRHNEVAPGQFEMAPGLRADLGRLGPQHGGHEPDAPPRDAARPDVPDPREAVRRDQRLGQAQQLVDGHRRGREPPRPGQRPARQRPVPGLPGGGHPRRQRPRRPAPGEHRRRRPGPPPRCQRGAAGDHVDLPRLAARGRRRAARQGRRPPARRRAARRTSGSPRCRSSPKDATDRNRTSPFAFTGNKFEFRAVGSSAPIYWPQTVLNTAVADSLDQLADELEKLKPGDFAGLTTILSKIVGANKQVLFEGNGYSEEWHAEAERRGLPNNRTTVDALPVADDGQGQEAVREVRRPLRARARRRASTSTGSATSRSSNIEASCALDIAWTMILPATAQYLGQLAAAPSSRGINAVCEQVSGLADSLVDAIDALEHAQHAAHEAGSVQAEARAFCDEVIPAQNALRDVADELETLVADDLWPLPKYRELLFQY